MNKLLRSSILLSTFTGLLVFSLGLVVLVGWYFGLNFITAVRPDYIPMAPSTALLFTISGLCVLLRQLYLHQEQVSRSERVLAFFILSVAIFLFILSVQHIHSSWEYLGLSITGDVAGSPIGHMSPITALSFIAVAISLIASHHISTEHPFYAVIGMGIAVAFFILCLIFFLAYLFGAPLLYDGSFIPPAINTLTGFLMIAIALFDTNYHGTSLCDNWLGKLVKNSTVFIWGFLVGVVVIISIAYAYHRAHEQDFYNEVSEQISAIAILKRNEIQHYYNERMDDARFFSHSHYFKELLLPLIEGNNFSSVNSNLKKVLSEAKQHMEIENIFVLDNSGKVLISTVLDNPQISSIIKDVSARERPLDQVYFQDFYRNELDGKIYLSLLTTIKPSNQLPSITVVLRIDPHIYLYPFIKQWPIISDSAESLLIRKEGDHVVFLNDLRFKDNTALQLRHSIKNESLPAAKAVNGFTGIVEGNDYRNIRVMADVRAIPKTPWFMVTRIDQSEIYSPLKERLWSTIVSVLSVIVALGLTYIVIWRQQRLTYYREQYETSLRLKVYGQIFAQNSEGIMVCDANQQITLINDAFSKITGYSAQEALGKNSQLLNSGSQDQAFYKSMWASINENGSWQGEILNRRKDGTEYPEWLTISVLHDTESDETSHYIGVFSDITRHKKDEENIRYLAHFDSLTGLPNRTLLKDRITQTINFSQRGSYSLTILFFDLDRFKNVNDSLGHRIGDLMLIEVANRLNTIMRQEDSASRLGGDEFVILLPETGSDGAANVANKIIESISAPFILEGSELSITPSVGISIYPNDGNDEQTLLQAAENAMYRAKDSGRNQFQFYTSDLFEKAKRKLEINNALRGAIDRQELELYYQPQIELLSGKLIGCEALLRWENSQLGKVSPGEFIPIAEASGLILSIDHWVLHEAIRQMEVWKGKGLLDFTVAVNLSANQFHHQGLLAMVQNGLTQHSIPAKYLELEMTEGLMMDDIDGTVKVIDSLHQEGLKLSIDDFGTGYSSLSYLKRFKIDKLKIDQSFVRDIHFDPDDAAIVKTIINLAESLGLKTIAEGVETKEQEQFLSANGCDEVQGYFYSQPIPADEFGVYIEQFNPQKQQNK